MKKLKRIGITLLLVLNFFSFNAYASPHDSREIYEIEQRGRALNKIDASFIELIGAVVEPVIYIGAVFIFIGLIMFIKGWISSRSEQFKAAFFLVTGALIVSIRTWLPIVFSKTSFYDEVLRVMNSIHIGG